jgi:hypothetical protein
MDILDEMDLPLANKMEELETISRNMFDPLFDPAYFELQSETKDKGVDYTIEIKHNQRHTNFRFSIQLKATNTKRLNVDGSISLQIHTSNINYLLNGSGVAYYVLFNKRQNKFLFKDISQFVKELHEKDPEWMKQGSHVLRFNKELTETSIKSIYQESLQRGRLQRTMNEKLSLKTASLAKGDKILIDDSLEVSDDDEIRGLVEQIGLTLINQGRWLEVLQLHRKASGNVASTPMYNLILGMASYYSGQYVDALGFIQKASKPADELPEQLCETRQYFEVIAKRAIGILNEAQYQEQIQELESDEGVGFYALLETAIKKYRTAIVDKVGGDLAFDALENDIGFILNHPKTDENIKLMAQCELLLYEGSRNNISYLKGVLEINAIEYYSGRDMGVRDSFVKKFFYLKSQWIENFKKIMKEAIAEDNFFAFHFANLNYVKVIYEQLVNTTLAEVKMKIPDQEQVDNLKDSTILTDLINKLEGTNNFYKKIGHAENQCAVLSTVYQLQHFAGKYTNAAKTLSELEAIVETYDLEESRIKLNKLRNGGTSHETLQNLMEQDQKDLELVKTDWDEKEKTMQKMDANDLNTYTKSLEGQSQIELFPIGYFQFPLNELDRVFKILGINKGKVKAQFRSMLNEGIIPVANILNYPILREGPEKGKLEGNKIEDWLNIYRVRKEFYEAEFRRFELKI